MARAHDPAALAHEPEDQASKSSAAEEPIVASRQQSLLYFST